MNLEQKKNTQKNYPQIPGDSRAYPGETIAGERIQALKSEGGAQMGKMWVGHYNRGSPAGGVVAATEAPLWNLRTFMKHG